MPSGNTSETISSDVQTRLWKIARSRLRRAVTFTQKPSVAWLAMRSYSVNGPSRTRSSGSM